MATYEQLEKKFIEASSRQGLIDQINSVIGKIEQDEFGFGTGKDVGRGTLFAFVLPSQAREAAKGALLASLRDSRHIAELELADTLRGISFMPVDDPLPSGVEDPQSGVSKIWNPAFLRKTMD